MIQFIHLILRLCVSAFCYSPHLFADTAIHEQLHSKKIKTEELQKIAQSPQWLRLLHFKTSWFSGQRSLNDGPGFFFAQNGQRDALAELKATIDAMNSDALRVGQLSLHPQCAFPARKRFIQKRLRIQFLVEVDCSSFEDFFSRFKDPQTISVVFSTAYPNNPASMFGHTFLKFHSRAGSDLTDIGINYAALVPPSEHPLAFIYFGIFGGYKGQWSTNNYHQKIKEYALSENRDLWEYELDISPEETRFLIEHIWELETNGHFDYFFFDENCSYHILAAIEAIKPEWSLTDHTIYVIPGESIKNLADQPGAIRKVHFRPGSQLSWRHLFDHMNAEERKQFKEVYVQKKLNGKESILQLNALINYLRYVEAKNKGQISAEDQELQKSLWVARAALGSNEQHSVTHPYNSSTRPDLGHDAYAMTVGQTLRNREDSFGQGLTTQFRIKSAYHDLLNKDQGFKSYSHIDFPSMQLQFDGDLNELRLDQIRALSITSLTPIEFGSRSISWKFDSGIETARDYGCLSCRHLFLEGGAGASFFISSQRSHLIYILGLARPEAYRGLRRGYRLFGGPEVGLLFNPTEDLKIQLGWKELFDLTNQQRASQQIRAWALRASWSIQQNLELRAEFDLLQPTTRDRLDQVQNTVSLTYFFR